MKLASDNSFRPSPNRGSTFVPTYDRTSRTPTAGLIRRQDYRKNSLFRYSSAHLRGARVAAELSIGGVVAGATEASVLRLLGEPSLRVETGEGTELQYPGLVVTVGWLGQRTKGGQQRVLALRGTGPEACTPRGLCPGMPASEVSRLYGPSVSVQREAGTFVEYQPPDVSCWLQVSAPADTVATVAVACQP